MGFVDFELIVDFIPMKLMSINRRKKLTDREIQAEDCLFPD